MTKTRELITIQKREKLNKVFSIGEVGSSGANYQYLVMNSKSNAPYLLDEGKILCDVGSCMGRIIFQCGPCIDKTVTHGVIDSDLLEIVRDRLKGYQGGRFASWENARALVHIEKALVWLSQKLEDGIEHR